MSWLSALKYDDALAGFCWLAMTVGLLVTSVRWTRHAFPRDRVAQNILHISILFVALVFLILTIIGTIGVLNSPLAWIVGTVAICVFVSRLLPSSETEAALNRKATADTSDNMDTNRAVSEINTAEIEPEPFGVVFLWCGLLSLLLGHMVNHGLLRFPTDWDTLMYHMPFIDHWLQTGTLATTHSFRWSNPANSELLGLWFAGMFSGDFLVSLNNLPVMIVWAAGLLELARQLGMTGWWRHFAAVACMAVHTTVHETRDASNDLMVAAFFISGIAYLLRFQKSRRQSDLALLGISLGVLAGTKHFALGYAAILIVAFTGLEIVSRVRMAKRMRHLAGVCGLTIMFGGYWYLRNLVLTGNPLYPVGSPQLHERIIYPDLSKTTLLFNGSPEVPGLAIDAVWNLCGPLHFVAIVLLPAVMLGCMIISLSRKSLDIVDRLSPLLLAGLTLGSFAVVLVTPMLVEDQPGTLNHLKWKYTPVRYGLSFLCLAMMALVLCLQAACRQLPQSLFTRGMTGVLPWVFGGAALYQLILRFWTRSELDMIVAVALGFDIVVLAAASLWLARLKRVGLLFTSGAWAILLAIAIGRIADRWHNGFDDHFNRFYATTFFTDQSSRRIVVLEERSYAFFGSRRQNPITQPQLFYGVEAVEQTTQEHQASLIVTRKEDRKQLYPYRPSWEALEKDSNFTLINKGRELRIFEYHAKTELEESHK